MLLMKFIVYILLSIMQRYWFLGDYLCSCKLGSLPPRWLLAGGEEDAEGCTLADFTLLDVDASAVVILDNASGKRQA